MNAKLGTARDCPRCGRRDCKRCHFAGPRTETKADKQARANATRFRLTTTIEEKKP